MMSAVSNAICRSCTVACLLAMLGGCASAPPAPPAPPPAPAPAPVPSPLAPTPPDASAPAPASTRYRCDHDVSFTVQYGDDSATLDVGQHGREVLLRDAGGVTPQQTVYSSERMRAEFGLGADGNEAVLRYADPPLVLRCVRG